jgi:hypothetical protein
MLLQVSINQILHTRHGAERIPLCQGILTKIHCAP